MKRWLKNKLRVWLGVDQAQLCARTALRNSRETEKRLDSYVTGAADVHFRGNTQLVVLTRLQGGTVQFYDFEAKDIHEIHQRALSIMGSAWPEAVIDAPREMARTFRQMGYDNMSIPQRERRWR